MPSTVPSGRPTCVGGDLMTTKVTHQPISKSDGTNWYPEEIKKVLGKRYLNPSGDHEIVVCCLIDDAHKRARINWERIGENVAGFTYFCPQCWKEFGKDNDEQFEKLVKWLSPRELVNGRWRRHLNPFDFEGKAPSLKFVHDEAGNAMFYEGGVHFVYGKPGTFKSWLALAAFSSTDSRLWDFENGISGTLGRLNALGVTREAAYGYTVPDSKEEILERIREYCETKPEILFIDGFSGFADVYGLNAESNNDVMQAFSEVFYPLKGAGVTVIILDHLPKESVSEDYPIGAQAKKSQADAAFLLKNTSQANQVDIYVSKDRHGSIFDRCEPGNQPRRYGTLQLNTDQEVISLIVRPAYQATVNGELLATSEARLMEQIYDYVQNNPDPSKVEIERNVLGKTERKRKALAALVEGGFIETRAVGTSHIHKVLKTFDPEWNPVGT